MYVLMEFLESCNPMHRKMTLSGLSRLIENPKTITYFCDWNSSKTMINSTRLLVKIYKEEDTRHSVQYISGILVNRKRPLNPKTAPEFIKKKKENKYNQKNKNG